MDVLLLEKDINADCLQIPDRFQQRDRIPCKAGYGFGDDHIVFSEWSFVMGTKMQRKDYRFDKLLAGEYEPKAATKKKKRVDDEYGQMNLLSMLEEKPSDEGEFLTSYVTDYRRGQDHGQ